MDSERRRREARGLRSRKRPKVCVLLIWLCCLPYLYISVAMVWESTLIPRDAGAFAARFFILYFPLLIGFVVHPLIGCSVLAACLWGYWRLIRKVRHSRPVLIACLVFALPGLAYILCVSGIPLRIAFHWNREAFEEQLWERAKRSDLSDAYPDNGRVGSYPVREIRTDPRRGVFFLLPEGGGNYPWNRTFFKGFAHDPSHLGTPWGDADYNLKHLEGDWYFFDAVSD